MANFDKAVTQVWRKNIDSLERLINEDSSILKMKNKYGRTLLHFAVNENAIDIVELLLNYDVDINSRDISDNTPLHFAIIKDFKEICELLLRNKADINIKNKFLNTPLHLAIEHSSLELIKLLIDNHADLNSRNKEGETALHLAVKENNIDILKLLVMKGADITIQNDIGESPLDYLTDNKLKNELIFIYNNKEKIIEEINQKGKEQHV